MASADSRRVGSEVGGRVMATADDHRFLLAWFPAAKVSGPAVGEPRDTNWATFVATVASPYHTIDGTRFSRRIGLKDGVCFVPARFITEPDGRMRRLSEHLSSRTAVALDVETKAGQEPPAIAEVACRIERLGW